MLGGTTFIGAGHMTSRGVPRCGAYAPAHYLKQFLPEVRRRRPRSTRKAKEAGFDNWVQHLQVKNDWALNPELPVLGPWKTVAPINTPTWVLERNPYYYAVDTEGNQLPYIDRIQLTLAENLEVLNLRAIAGEYDLQERHIDLGKLPVFLENQQKGNYKVHLDPGRQRRGRHAPDQPELRRRPRDREVADRTPTSAARSSLGIDRDQLNETFWLGVGTPGSVVPARELAVQSRARSGARSGRRSTSSRRTSCSTRSG